MVRWVNAQNFGSPIADAITKAGSLLYGDRLTPALKQEQLTKAQRENDNVDALGDMFQNLPNNSWGGGQAGPAMSMPAAPAFRAPTPKPPPMQMGVPAPAIGAATARSPQDVMRQYDVAENNADPGFGYGQRGQSMDVGSRLMADLQQRLGLTAQQAAGVVGNLAHESGGFKQMQEVQPLVPGSRGGYGYAQWTGPRRVAFEQFAQQQGLSPDSYEANLGFLEHELTATPEGRVMAALSQAQTPEEAAMIFSQQFLRPGIPHNDRRVSLARQYADGGTMAFTGNPAPNATQPLGGQYLPGASPGGMNPQAIADMAAAAIRGGVDPQNVAEALRMFAANAYGAENQAATNAFLGAGGNYANTYSGFAANQNRQERDSVRDAGVQMRGQDIVDARQRDPNLGDADWFILPDGSTINSRDGVRDVNGNPLPPGTRPLGKSQVVGGSGADIGLTTATTNQLQGQELAQAQFGSLLDLAQNLAETSPDSFGFSGEIRRVGRDVQGIVGAATELMGEAGGAEAQRIVQDAAQNADPGVQQALLFADPNLDQIDVLETMLAYQLAKAQNPDGRISNEDFFQARQNVKLRGWLQTPDRVISRISGLRQSIGALQGATDAVTQGNTPLSGYRTGPNAPAAAPLANTPIAPAAPQITPADIAVMSTQQVTEFLQSIDDPSTLPDEVLDAIIARGGN